MAAFILGIIGLAVGITCFVDADAAFGGGFFGALAGVSLGLIVRQAKQQRVVAAALKDVERQLEELRRAAVAAPMPEPAAVAAAPAVAVATGGAAAPPAIQVGTIENGYRFKGGDPADPNAWERVGLTGAAEEAPLGPSEPPRPAVAEAAEVVEPMPAEMAPPAITEVPEPVAAEAPATAAAADAPPSPPPVPPAWSPPPPSPAELFLQKSFAAAGDWLRANVLLAAGLVVLFIGCVFAVKLAAPYVFFPVELRYASVALGGIILLGLGWYLRERRPTYGLALQGFGVAILYLTIFAAMRLQQLVPPGMAFGLLVVIVFASSVLAVVQDAMVLAVVGAAGGFAAPILTASGGEHHVALFSYYALLNTGILTIAWFKAWRPLNLIGFIATLVIAGAWGAGAYRPEMLATIEPFLILFFLMYVAIALLFARRVLADATTEPAAQDRASVVKWAAQQSNYLDGTLLFGAPIVGFGLQYGLVKDIEYATAFSALALGFFYMLLALVVFRRTQWRYLALLEVYLALGVVFATLALPLGLDASWTSAAWAVEGAGVYWIGVKQDRRLARAFALLVQFGAAVSYLATLRLGSAGTCLISGSRLGAAMLGAAMLFTYWQLRGVPAAKSCDEDKPARPTLAATGLAFLYLVAPLSLRSDGTAVAWAIAGLVTLVAGVRLKDRSWMITALVIQVLGGAVFVGALPSSSDLSTAVLGSGWRGLFVAGLVGGVALASFVMVARDPEAKLDPVVMRGLSLLLLFGLVFINLAALFVLPWRLASGVWAASGMLILLASLHFEQRLSFAFGLVLQVLGGGAFLFGAYPALRALSPEGLTPLLHSGFWTPAVIALAGYGGAWLLFRAGKGDAKAVPPPLDTNLLSVGLLAWATMWWTFAWLAEIVRFLPEDSRAHAMIVVTAATVLLWMLTAWRWEWRALAAFCALSMPASVLALLVALNARYHPAAHLGALAWPALLVAHLVVLRRIPALLSAKSPSYLHVVGCWLFLGVLALETRFLLLTLSDHWNAWHWVGWASVPVLYLWIAALERFPAVWPFLAYEREYRVVAALPVAAVVLGWFWISNVASDGSAEPLPYVALLNPLELGQMAALLALLLWLRARLPTVMPKPVPAELGYWVVGASGFILLTCAVPRAAHQWLDIPYEFHELFASMLVQASLSILWSVVALASMVTGHVRRLREVWIAGAVLIGVVVVKLFLVELFNVGGVSRIVSFIGVGVLLLAIGYFAPLPPKHRAVMEKPAE